MTEYGEIVRDRKDLFKIVCSQLIDGDVAEFGVYKGESLEYIADLTNCERNYYGFDSFEGMPESKYETIFYKGKFGVKDIPILECKNIKLIKGWFQDTLVKDKTYFDKLALIHIDSDIYESAVIALEYCHDYIQKGTIIQFDEIWAKFANPEQHEYKAWQEYIEKYNIKYEVIGSTNEKRYGMVRGAFRIIDFKERDIYSKKLNDTGEYVLWDKTSNSFLSKFTGRDGEDRWVLEETGYKENGYFVDIGASNGVRNSNTYILEKYFKWDGICVEPNQSERAFPSLVKNRNCICESSVIFGESTIVKFLSRGKKFEQSGIFGDFSSKSIKDVVGAGHPVVDLQSITFNELLLKHNAPKVIDYLSIDTEGSEWEILKEFDFDTYDIRLITVEHNREKEKRERIKNLLEGNRFKLNKSVNVDDYYSKD